MFNSTTIAQHGANDPRLPQYHLAPKPPLLSFLSDQMLFVIAPVVLYWTYGIIFYLIDYLDYLPQYRLHTPEEFLKRNRVPMIQVIGYVLFYQLLTVLLGLYLVEGEDLYGKEAYDVVTWAIKYQSWWERLGHASQLVMNNLHESIFHPSAAVMLLLREWIPTPPRPNTQSMLLEDREQIFLPLTQIQLRLANTTYWYIVPTFRFLAAIAFADTWQYFYHRAVHLNRWLFLNLHASHHRVYVPYAFGTFYSNLIEAFLVDIISTSLSLYFSGLTTRQAMWFVNLSVLKAVDDHSGYAIPWNPLQRLTPQTALYHDVHHQSWGIKTNFAQVYTTFWDHAMGTVWQGEDIDRRYVRGEQVAREWNKVSGLTKMDNKKRNKNKQLTVCGEVLHSMRKVIAEINDVDVDVDVGAEFVREKMMMEKKDE